MVSEATWALVLAHATWSISWATKPFFQGNSTAVREEEERRCNSRLRFTSNQKGNNPHYIINPQSHVKFHLFSLKDFLQATKTARPTIKHYISHVCENPGGTAVGLRTGNMGSRLNLVTSHLCDNGQVTFPLWLPASVLVKHHDVKIPSLSSIQQ